MAMGSKNIDNARCCCCSSCCESVYTVIFRWRMWYFQASGCLLSSLSRMERVREEAFVPEAKGATFISVITENSELLDCSSVSSTLGFRSSFPFKLNHIGTNFFVSFRLDCCCV